MRAASSSLLIDGREYRSVEHYFQSAKYATLWPEAAADIAAQATALAAKKRNTHYKRLKPIDVAAWDAASRDTMLRALRAKFAPERNAELARALLMTGDVPLAEVGGRSADKWSGKVEWPSASTKTPAG